MHTKRWMYVVDICDSGNGTQCSTSWYNAGSSILYSISCQSTVCVQAVVVSGDTCYDFPFLLLSLYFWSSFHSIPFRPHFCSTPMSLIHEALLVSLIYDSQASRLTSLSSPALPCTALWLTLTHFHLEAAPPLYFPSIWLVMTQPLSLPD